MGYLDFRSPTSFRLTTGQLGLPFDPATVRTTSPFVVFTHKPHDAHPAIGHLILLVFEAVMEVVCVSLPGYIIASMGQFDADKQKFLANLNVQLFTPCLIFTKLASQLNADKLVELGVIPVIFVIQTLVSYLVATGVSKCFGFNKRASNFVTAMGVFGNSNSLPISLVISLSATLKGLHWDKIPGDNDDEVAARGILYLLIFQQLGQLVRWSWGYHVLLAPKDKYEEYNDESAEEGRFAGEQIQNHEEVEGLIVGIDIDDEMNEEERALRARANTQSSDSEGYDPAGLTPVASTSRVESEDEHDSPTKPKKLYQNGYESLNGHSVEVSDDSLDGILSFPRIRNCDEPEIPPGLKGYKLRAELAVKRTKKRTTGFFTSLGRRTYNTLPRPIQSTLKVCYRGWLKVYTFIWEFMNPPLWAMLCAIIVASVPDLQRLFFEEGSFIKNSVTSAVSQSAGVAVPLILVVLGANLARNTQKRGDATDAEEKLIGTKLLVASLICRMLLPTLIMAPILALFAKYVPVSILDDPIFVIVCFLLTGAPSALQLAQICQINGVFEDVMSKILFQSYVIWILPSTLILVMCALEVVEWAS
ncbi:auxin efflux carrier [Coniochaeta sp. 2T2.1]|nr:auxin efflux carrier [Coniochaeta sp. 2T2.1]